MKRIQLAIGAGIVAALGAIAATVWVGLAVREDTVVAHPYEDGLRQDAERHARAALGLAVSIGASVEAGVAPLEFELKDRDGNPVDDAAVAVEISRPETSRGERSARATSLGGGRWSAHLAFPEGGPWDVRFDVVRGEDRVRLERRVDVREACDVAQRQCSRVAPGGVLVAFDVSPRPPRAMTELALRVVVAEPLAGQGPRRPIEEIAAGRTPRVTVSFAMPGMAMGENRSSLSLARESATPSEQPRTDVLALAYQGKAVLVRCASGRRDWIADVELAYPDGARRTVRFSLRLPEDAR